jgi:flagellar hook-associated protein 3
MSIRPTQQAVFSQIERGMLENFSRLVRAQEQISSGKRIVKPSDDPVGASQALAFKRQIAAADRNKTSVQGARVMLDTASSLLQDGGGTLSEARAVLLQAMNGTQSDDDRRLFAGSIDLIRDRMIEVGNSRAGNRYLFAGTATDSAPFVESGNSVRYSGNNQSQNVRVGEDARVMSTISGGEIFALEQRTGTQFSGLTGLASGTSADQGTGYRYVSVRHDSTAASGLSSGLALAGGASDSILGAHTLVIDGVAGTAQLDNGALVHFPATTASTAGDVVVTNEHGAEVHIDFSAYDGTSSSATLTGAGSVSLDGTTWTSMALTEPDLELTSADGTVLHLDTRGLHRAGVELVTFGGTVNVFDVLQGISNDMNNMHDLSPRDLRERLDMWLGELDRNHENIQIATGELGSLSQRATGLEESFDEQGVQIQGLLSDVEDVDFSKVVLDLNRAEQTLQLAQATSMRLLQNSLLNFLR